jgi:acetyltransferase-like isoleucine patch superfamily enzyme
MDLVRTSEAIIRKLKRDPSYRIESVYTNRQLIAILMGRFFQALRGAWLKARLGESKGIIFAGRRVVVEHAYAVRAQHSLIVEDNVFINGLSKHGINLGSNVTIAKGSILICTGVISNMGEGIQIGNNSAVGAQSFFGGQGGIKIGNDVIMGPHVRIFSENHNTHLTGVLLRKQGESRKGVSIENNCWIGAGVTILDGVTIGEGAVVAAGSVVTKSVPPFALSGGVPAKVLKSRISL